MFNEREVDDDYESPWIPAGRSGDGVRRIALGFGDRLFGVLSGEAAAAIMGRVVPLNR